MPNCYRNSCGTQDCKCYLPLIKGDISAFTPANNKAGTWFSDPEAMLSWPWWFCYLLRWYTCQYLSPIPLNWAKHRVTSFIKWTRYKPMLWCCQVSNMKQRTAHVCISLCTPVVHGTVQNSDFPPNLQEIIIDGYYQCQPQFSTRSFHKFN